MSSASIDSVPEKIHMASSAELPTLLIVDDDSVCVMALQRALRRVGVDVPTVVARDGQEALETLRALAETRQQLPKILVSLDLNMPRMNGVEFLAQLRSEPALRRAVVFVQTTSDSPADVRSCYNHNVSGYLVKGHGSGQLDQVIELFKSFTQAVTLPS